MAGVQACLIDVWHTVVDYDFAVHAEQMPLVAGVPGAIWNEAFLAHGEELNDGRLSIGEAYAAVLETLGRPVDVELVERLRARDRELLLESVRPFADTMPFLTMLRASGVATAFVSNCADGTRPLLDHLGLSELVDALVLSCEVGTSKPDTPIYRHALDALGVAPEAALFVDDQPSYCAGARALGMRALCLSRTQPGRDGQEIASLLDVEPLL